MVLVGPILYWQPSSMKSPREDGIMFNQIYAVDVADSIPDFLQKIQKFSLAPPIIREMATSAWLDEQKKTIDAVLVSIYQELNESFLQQLPSLKYIFVLGTSLKKIDMQYCHDHGITVRNVTEYCDNDTAEWVMLKIIEHFRRRSLPRSVFKKPLGVVGVGFVGKKLIELAHGFGMNIFFNAESKNGELEKRGIERLSKEQLFARCDVISCHTPPLVSWLTKDILVEAQENLCIINTCMGRISVDRDLENFLNRRADVTVIMDKIAGDSYRELSGRVHISLEAAFDTLDSQNRLIEKFFHNLGRFTEKKSN
jgi:lactate dehydrogenase-like 2-hydroxyacid dehydrogenase